MKHLFFLLSVIVFVGCSNNSDSEKNKHIGIKETRELHQSKPSIPININYDSLDSSVKIQIKKLDSIYGRTPYYTIVKNKKLFIVMSGKSIADSVYYLPKFSGRFKYGVVDDSLKPLLSCNYDKIYNPNLCILNCMEIKNGDKIGLFDFTSKEILEPQFEYITPSSIIPNNIAYGFKNGNWYKIENNKFFTINKSNFSPIEILKELSFNVQDLKENVFFGSYNFSEADEPSYGLGVAFTPSYIEHLNIMPEICEDVILPQQSNTSFGTNEMNIKTDTVKINTNKIISFILSFYQQGVDGRGFVDDSKRLIVYNKEKNIFNSKRLNYGYDGYNTVCLSSGCKFINDTLIEILESSQTDNSKINRYLFENAYYYKTISKEGEIKDLQCNRYYAFTKYIEINENYFKGCYAKYMIAPNNEYTDSIWVSEHLTIDDLDVMINEIYAEYGFKFKSSKWKTYFSQFKWYHPQYDNIDRKLSIIDKKNIETIAKEKEKMKGKEDIYVKKHKETYSPAG